MAARWCACDSRSGRNITSSTYRASVLRADSGPAINRAVGLLNRSKKSVIVEGHTDDKSTHEYNQALSRLRYICPYITSYKNNKNVLLSWIVFLPHHEVVLKSKWSETWKTQRS
ncbi:hypothetical protein AWB79_04949 [Caballeronia hypogeia]|uniref:Uncharacterized protein n=1 Tax=Caballeronia hypogeia TaxID=1777140 RepID=A0A158C8X0_9BURK|nr:OmpA family protein [Caballeronia hypogeia]SAK78784.1 hypothetical protein AWB79_04949 [Caballeronia hypogeia]